MDSLKVLFSAQSRKFWIAFLAVFAAGPQGCVVRDHHRG